MTQTPSVGRVVHYVSYGTPGGEYRSQCRAATIAEVGAWVPVETSLHSASPLPGDRRTVTQEWDPEACALVVQNPTGLFFNTCRHDEGGTSDTPGAPTARSFPGGTWHWPGRVEDGGC